MSKRQAELETHLRQLQADQGGGASFKDFLAAVIADPAEQGHIEALEFVGAPYIHGVPSPAYMPSDEIKARSAQVDDWIYIKDQGRAVFKVVGKTLTDPPDNVEVELVRDPFKEAHFHTGDVWGGESVRIIRL